MRPINIPFSDRRIFDAFDPAAELPKCAGVYVWVLTDRHNPASKEIYYIGRARSVRERCLGKFGAKYGTSDHRLLADARGFGGQYHIELWVYPLPKFNPWINFIEAKLIKEHWGDRYLHNAKIEPIPVWVIPFYAVVAFVDGVLSGAIDGLLLAIVGTLTYAVCKAMRLI
jgi:hypothetical protein